MFAAPHHLALNVDTLSLRYGVAPVIAPSALGAGVLPAHFFAHGIMRTGANWSVS